MMSQIKDQPPIEMPTTNKTVIQVSGVGKEYELGNIAKDSIKDSIRNIFDHKKSEKDSFWALKNISFEVKEGEVLGIVGKNGAGKSTLLKVLSRITYPTEGTISMEGRVASLLEVGTGFHPELSGRENIFLNGSILGMNRKEIKSKFDEIVDFSGVEKFIDTPVKHYSSGMYVRLAFSVAAHLEPEILIIDEVLAVGDAEFQNKCLGKMKDVAGQGRTVLFVSHNMAAVETLCTKAIFLENGRIKDIGDVGKIIESYLYSGSETVTYQKKISDTVSREGDGEVKLDEISISSKLDQVSPVSSGSACFFKLKFDSKISSKQIVVRLSIFNSNNDLIFICNNFHSKGYFNFDIGMNEVICKIAKLPLFKGDYRIEVLCLSGFDKKDLLESAIVFPVGEGDFFGTGKVPGIQRGIIQEHQWQ